MTTPTSPQKPPKGRFHELEGGRVSGISESLNVNTASSYAVVQKVSGGFSL